MNIHIYVKNTEDINTFDDVVNIVKSPSDDIFISMESRRCFRELDSIKKTISPDDIVIVGDLPSLGLNGADIAGQLDWFISQSKKLVICSYLPTYEYGVSQPMNKAVLNTILQSVLNNSKNIAQMPGHKKTNAGRNKVSFPDNWDELYEKWDNKEITSKEFIYLTGLKKATFYNLLTEYREIQETMDQYIRRYKSI